MKNHKADIILLGITLIWASTFSIIKSVLSEISPFVFIFLRFVVALLLFTALSNKRIILTEGKTLLHGSILGILFSIGFCAQIFGLQFTSASKSAFITGTLVVFAPIFQMIIEKKLINIWQIIGVLFAGIGLYFLSSPKGGEINLGDILTLLSAMVFGVYVVYTGIFSKVSNISGLVFLQFLIIVLVSLPLTFIFENFSISYSSNIVLSVLYTAIFATVICIYLQTRYQKDTTPTRAAIIYTFEPLFAAFIAFAFFSEIIGNNILIGGGLIISGLLFAEFSEPFSNFAFKKGKSK